MLDSRLGSARQMCEVEPAPKERDESHPKAQRYR